MSAQPQHSDAHASLVARAAALLGVSEAVLIQRAATVFVRHRRSGASLRRFIELYAQAIVLNAEASRSFS